MQYIIPYPQQNMDQKYGLSSLDIAKAVDVPISKINEKINRPEFKSMCDFNSWQLISAAIKSAKSLNDKADKYDIDLHDKVKSLL